MAAQQRYTRLRNIILATTLCFAILPMLVVGVVIPIQFTGLYNEKTVREVENVARSKGRTIDIFFEERTSQLKSLAGMFSFEELTSPGKLAEILRTIKANSQSYVDLGVIDMEGNHAAYAGSYDVLHVNYKNENWFAEVRRKGVFVSDVFLGFRKFPHIIIAVMREEGNRSWILRATIDSAVFTSIVQASRLSTGGDAFVVSRDGMLQTESLLAGQLMGKVDIAWPRRGDAPTSEGALSGKNMLIAKVPLANAPWMLVVAEDPSEHISLLFKARSMAAAIILFGLAALSIGTWLTTRMIIRRLVEADKQKAAYDASLLQSSKMAALGKMAAGISHEINNPLMLIREHAGWMRDLLEDEKPEKMEHYEELQNAAIKVEQNVDRAKDITHRLLGFARRVDPSSESLPLNPIVDQAIAFLHNEANYRGITIERNFSKKDLRVSTDVGQLQQVVLNILDNAIDAVGQGGKVTVSTLLDDNGQACVILRDNGPGIPEDRLAQIFDPFFTTKKTGEGTGLGLSICYSIMDSLSGSVCARNHPEGGAEFTVSLPASGQH